VSLTLTAVIPTKNRPDDLRNALASVLTQTRRPDELLIVDQSAGEDSLLLSQEMCGAVPGMTLTYIHDPTVTGLVDAKRVGSSRAAGDVICFLEDDVILEPAYFAEIAAGFRTRPDMIGCSGIQTNPPRTSPLYVAAHDVFFRGIFRDGRVRHTLEALDGRAGLIACDVLSGGLSCWRRHVFVQVTFDVANGFHLLEDMEFSTRVVQAFGHHLYINPRARLEHVGSPVNRDLHGARQRRKTCEALMFYRKRRGWSGAGLGLLSVMVWWLGEACVQAVRNGTPGPIRGYVRGIADGIRRPLVV
jgi:GT2 family glycosyltransferase